MTGGKSILDSRVKLVSQEEAMKISDIIDSTLNSPIKRLGACIAAAGLLSVIVGAIQIALDASYFEDALHYFFISATWIFTDHPYRVFKAVAYGVPLALVGLAFSFFYDAGVGKVIGWILRGRDYPRERRA